MPQHLVPVFGINHKLIRSVFHTDVVNQIMTWDHDIIDLCSQLDLTVFSFISPSAASPKVEAEWRVKMSNPPSDMQDFLETVSPAFTDDYIQHLSSRAAIFNEISGFPDLATAFMQERSVRKWISVVVRSLAERVRTVEIKGFAQFDGPCEEENCSTFLPQVYGPSDGSSSMFAPSLADQENIIQIDLSGATVKEAWMAHTKTRQMEQSVPQGDWSPTTPGAFLSYHGTSAHFSTESVLAAALNTPKDCMRRQSNRNQMAPLGVHLLYTAFSPLRCYLWAMFNADPIQSIPSDALLEWANKEWFSRPGQLNRGLVLLSFAVSQPTMTGLTWEMIPAGKQDQWYDLTKQLEYPYPSPDLPFAGYSSILGKPAGTAWPDLIHGLELTQTKARLAPFLKNHWRTIWISQKAEDVLNASHQETMSITLEITRVIERSLASAPRKDHTSDGGKGGVRKALHKMKSLSFGSKKPKA